MPGIARWRPPEDQLDWFKRLNRQYLTPLGLASRDLVQNFCSKMRSRRRRRPAYDTHHAYTTEQFTYTVNSEDSDCEELVSETPPEPPSKLSPFAATAVPRPPVVYMVDTPDIMLPWPFSNSLSPWEQSSTPGPQRAYSFEIAPRSPSPQLRDPPPTNHIRAWNRYSRRLELFLPNPESRPGSPIPMPLRTGNVYPAASPVSDRRPRTSTCASRELRRLPSVESGFGPAFGLNQFRGEWLRVSQSEPGTHRRSIRSDTLESIPEDQLINLQVAADNSAPVSGHRSRSSLASSAWSPRRSARHSAYRQ